MKSISSVSLEAGRELLDFGGQSISGGMAEEQLQGAVAIHNMLAKEGVAYLADEVGMGKTYVALGAVALLRHYHPDLRVLYIAPRENIQRKWLKEHANFVSSNFRVRDLCVRSLTGQSATPLVACDNLADWARGAVLDSHRDFVLRLTSFSFPLPRESERWKEKRAELLELTPALEGVAIDLRNKEQFKASYACALNTVLPHYDLVVIDEAHNLKHGRRSKAARNMALRRLLGLEEEGELPRGYGRRFDRLLLLSATPLETDFRELWNQLDLLGFGAGELEGLCDNDLPLDDRRALAAQFMVRRITGLSIAEAIHTKNMYRREWRAGGTSAFDEPLEISSDRQRLVVALVQKKVAEVISSPRFGSSFQMGMLASFESFSKTAKVSDAAGEQDAAFDDLEQTDDDEEREGVDSNAVNRLSQAYERTFGEPMPHPKMDALVDGLKETFETGDKTLVFVRRVNSVPELIAKLGREYDEWLLPRLREALPAKVAADFQRIEELYEEERSSRAAAKAVSSALERERRKRGLGEDADDEVADALEKPATDDDAGGRETFFSWFFRGEGPSGWLSGAAFRKNRLQSEGSFLSTVFDDNYVLDLLDWPNDPVDAVANACAMAAEAASDTLRAWAWRAFRHVSAAKRASRYAVFHAYQQAALGLLANRAKGEIKKTANTVLSVVYPGAPHGPAEGVADNFPPPAEPLSARTFFTELRHRPSLQRQLWPQPASGDSRSRLEDRERRRELLGSVARLGHAFIDVWLTAIKLSGTMKLGERGRGDDQAEAFANALLDELEEQQNTGTAFGAFAELAAVGQHHDLILRTNFPEALRMPIRALARMFGDALGSQMPIGGMYGGVNQRLVRQFRMPGYPIVLITTDVLQEGEDLHTFCSRVVHYGISWTPSSMEQRTGRVDRISSLVHRRLDGREEPALGEEKLQVFYPYLSDSVERLQVARVLERMNRFLRSVHTRQDEPIDASRLDVAEALSRASVVPPPIEGRLESAFPVAPELLKGRLKRPRHDERELSQLLEHFKSIVDELRSRLLIEVAASEENYALYGTLRLVDGLVIRAESELTEEARRQPFALYLRPSASSGFTLLHVSSPVGQWSSDSLSPLEILKLQSELPGLRLCDQRDDRSSYTLSAESEIVFSPKLTQPEEVEDLLVRSTLGAAWMEQRLFGGLVDESFDVFAKELRQEASHVSR